MKKRKGTKSRFLENNNDFRAFISSVVFKFYVRKCKIGICLLLGTQEGPIYFARHDNVEIASPLHIGFYLVFYIQTSIFYQ